MSKNKDEEIKLYMSAITTRDPSKRQVKPVDINAFQLFDDLESESDEDFVVGSDQLSDDQHIESDDENVSTDEEDNNGNENSSSSSDSSKNTIIKSVKVDNVTKLDEIDQQSSDIKIESKTKLENVMICMMCLQDVGFSDNEIVECDSCGVVVHEDCYKISDNVFLSCDASDCSTDPWFCDACLTGVEDPRCELCPVEGGVFKRTENNRWVHLLCALYTPGVAFNDTENLSEITLSELPIKDWSARECSLCPNPFFARTGVCIGCDAGLCKNFFHVLCAQREGLLSEPNNEENSDDPYFANCRQHTDKETVKRRRKNWNAAVNRQKLRLEEWSGNGHFDDDRLKRKKEFFASMYNKALDIAPTPFVPLTKVPCYLETNPVAVFLFKKKATNLRLSQDVLNSQTSTDSKMITSGIPVFGPDFISYFLDREKKIDETTSEIVRLESLQRQLQISEQNTSHQFNKTISKKELVAKEYQNQLEELLKKVEFLKLLVKNRDLIEVLTNLTSKYEPVISNGNGNGNESVNSFGDKDSAANNKPVTKTDSIINECYMCKSVSDQHLLIDCDNCRKFVHIGCLDPPLTRMPRKTKLYGWQCSRCASGSTDEEVEKIDVNKPRQLRGSSDVKTRLSRVDEISTVQRLSQKLLKKTKQRTMRQHRTRSRSLTNKSDQINVIKSEDETNNHLTQSPKSPEKAIIANQDIIVVLEETGEPNPDKSLPVQRKSDRQRKRPLTLLDEYETSEYLKRPKFQKTLKFLGRKKSKSFSNKSDHKPESQLVVALTNDRNINILSTSSMEQPEIPKQRIIFYPSEESISSKNSTESEQVQIGIVAKKPTSSSLRDSISGTQKCLEKKSILIKCHDEQDDDQFPDSDTVRFSGASSNTATPTINKHSNSIDI